MTRHLRIWRVTGRAAVRSVARAPGDGCSAPDGLTRAMKELAGGKLDLVLRGSAAGRDRRSPARSRLLQGEIRRKPSRDRHYSASKIGRVDDAANR